MGQNSPEIDRNNRRFLFAFVWCDCVCVDEIDAFTFELDIALRDIRFICFPLVCRQFDGIFFFFFNYFVEPNDDFSCNILCKKASALSSRHQVSFILIYLMRIIQIALTTRRVAHNCLRIVWSTEHSKLFHRIYNLILFFGLCAPSGSRSTQFQL